METFVLEQLDKLRNRADNTATANRTALQAKLNGLEVCVRVCVCVCVCVCVLRLSR
jgi:hypothetical protein